METKRLIIRISSLGDLILATSALAAPLAEKKVDWVTSHEYATLLMGHPKIDRVIGFDRRNGLRGWVGLCRVLWESHYSEIYDLHCTLRTRLMRVLFRFWSWREKRPSAIWSRISKQRPRLTLFYILKRFMPGAWRPKMWVERYSRCLGGDGNERPDFAFLCDGVDLPHELKAAIAQRAGGYICVMPSSKWDGKKWPVDSYVELLKRLSYFSVILGQPSDKESLELVEKLRLAKISHYDGVGKWDFRKTARVLTEAKFYLGGDTGLSHFAEALGTPARVIFGPTDPAMGFGPWRKDSQAIESSLWCRPCGKDGSNCFRVFRRYECIRGLTADAVFQKLDAFDQTGSFSQPPKDFTKI